MESKFNWLLNKFLYVTIASSILFILFVVYDSNLVRENRIENIESIHSNVFSNNPRNVLLTHNFVQVDDIKRQDIIENKLIDSLKSKESTSEQRVEQVFSDILSKPYDFLFKYVNLPLDFRYGSNSIPLALSTLLTTGDILELGMGMFSTPLLHKIAADHNRKFVSVDTEFGWIQKFVSYNLTSMHRVYQITTQQLNTFGMEQKWGMVLVDHLSGATRFQNIINFANSSQIVVAHDAERQSDSFYLYEAKNVRSYFKYACKFSIYDQSKSYYISTLILSNSFDVSRMKKIFDSISTDFGHVSCDLNMKK